jgi:hypothetical protein
MDFITYKIVTDTATRVTNDTINFTLDKYWFLANFRKWNMWDEMIHDEEAQLKKLIYDHTNKLVNKYVNGKFKETINRELIVQFPTFLANEPEIKRLLAEHQLSISEMLDRKKEAIALEIDSIAKATADKMAHRDEFGPIYKAITDKAYSKIDAVTLDLAAKMRKKVEDDISEGVKKRDAIIERLEEENSKLANEIDNIRTVRHIAKGSMAVSFVTLMGVAFHILKNW